MEYEWPLIKIPPLSGACLIYIGDKVQKLDNLTKAEYIVWRMTSHVVTVSWSH